MATITYLETVRNRTLATELDALDTALERDLPEGVYLIVDGDALCESELRQELQDWRAVVAMYAKPSGTFEELLAYSPYLAKEARAFVRSVRVALGQYVEVQWVAPEPRGARGVAKGSLTRELRHARPEPGEGVVIRGPFPWVD